MSIELRDVSFTYAPGSAYQSNALRHVSCAITDGEFIGIMGRTGSGKSTLIQCIAGLLTPASGQVLLDGTDINSRHYDRSILRKKIGVVFQFPEIQLFETTVEKDVGFGPRNLGWNKQKVQEAVRAALERVGFDYDIVREKSPLEFSGGEKRRLAIAGILAANPDILILDEPIAGLDPAGRLQFLNLLRALNHEGKSILMISHNADALAETADRILVFEDGQLIRDGSAASVFSDTAFLRAHSIGIPQTVTLAETLRNRGLPVPAETIRYDQMMNFLNGGLS